MPSSSASSSSRANSYESEESNVASSSTSAQSSKGPGLSLYLSPRHSREEAKAVAAEFFVPEYDLSPSLLKHNEGHSFPFGLPGLVGSRRSSHALPKRRLTSLVTLCLALSIPVLGLLTAREWIRRDQRIKLWEKEWSQFELETRWGVVPRALELEEVERIKEWYGNRDVVGPSPFDHVPEPLPAGKEKRRFLLLTDYKDYLERMNSHTYEIADAALRHPHIIADVWGPGWAGYDRSLPLSLNVRRRAHRIAELEASKRAHEERVEWERYERDMAQSRWAWFKPKDVEVEREDEVWQAPEWVVEARDDAGCASVQWDVVFTVSNIFREDDPQLDALDCGALFIQQLGDCHSLSCTHEWYPYASNMTVSKYAHETIELFSHDKVIERYPGFEMQLFGHSPDSGNEWDFYPIPWNEKKQDARVFGYDGSFYPLRTKITDHIRDHPSDAIIERHPHPGYTLAPPGPALAQPLETYVPHHEYYAQHERLREDFAAGMRTSRICVFDASLERKMIRKYAQAFLSGCVVAGDLPTEHESALEKFMIVLKPSWDIERINREIQWHLDRPSLMQRKALEAFAYARRYLTNTNKVSGILSLSDKYRAGHRGYDFPYSFSLRCRAYWSNEDSYRPPWCDAGPRGLEE